MKIKAKMYLILNDVSLKIAVNTRQCTIMKLINVDK